MFIWLIQRVGASAAMNSTAVRNVQSWHGLAEISHEALLARSGETLRYTATLPARPRLDLELGSIEDAAVTFRVELREGTDTPAILLERTVTTPERWEPVAIDLGAWAGRSVELALSVHATEPGVIGLFGNPVLRSLVPLMRRDAPTSA